MKVEKKRNIVEKVWIGWEEIEEIEKVWEMNEDEIMRKKDKEIVIDEEKERIEVVDGKKEMKKNLIDKVEMKEGGEWNDRSEDNVGKDRIEDEKERGSIVDGGGGVWRSREEKRKKLRREEKVDEGIENIKMEKGGNLKGEKKGMGVKRWCKRRRK